ncbi:MAG: transporter substrate-binding domain-containing protein [Actinomycetota bacterium]|nr:MAG: transporter substrate-binding domain-containing protein [Actinomycetota bacterium]
MMRTVRSMKLFRVSGMVAVTSLGGAVLASCSNGTNSASTTSTVASAGSSTTVSASNAFLQDIKQRGAVRLGVIPDPPFMYLDSKTNLWSGPYIAVIQNWAKSLGVKVDYVPTTYATVIAAVQAHKIDLAAGISYTAARAAVVRYSVPTWTELQSVAINTSSTRATTWDEINSPNYTICVVQGAEQAVLMSANPSLFKFKTLTAPNVTTCQLQVTSGRANGFFYSWLPNGNFASTSPNIKLIFASSSVPTTTAGSYVIDNSYPKNDLDPLNTAITNALNTGVFATAEKAAGVVNPLDYAASQSAIPAYVKTAAAKMFTAGNQS